MSKLTPAEEKRAESIFGGVFLMFIGIMPAAIILDILFEHVEIWQIAVLWAAFAFATKLCKLGILSIWEDLTEGFTFAITKKEKPTPTEDTP